MSAEPALYDPLAADFPERLPEIYRTLRDHHPVYRHPGRGCYVLSRYDDVKWAAAEHIVMQDRVTGCPHRFEVSVEGKDIEADRFFFDVSPRGSGAEKFTCAGTAAELHARREARGEQNRQAELEVLAGGARPLGIEEVLEGLRQRGTRLGRATVRRHLTALVQAGAAVRSGSGTSTSYSVSPPSEPAAHLPPTERQDAGRR